ncbi:TetR/AcrR family transcriptional regulator [Streptomyces liangshanensis]|uniref:TetR/AcrR family transcriptional regulator n=1 Tax=Streptomyces liangshanensis TaxID=2717324 RepID=UPI0036DD5821
METPRQRARSGEDKARRRHDLLNAAYEIAARTSVRELMLSQVTAAVGLDPSALRRYFSSREELLLELAETRGLAWAERLCAELGDGRRRTREELARTLTSTLAADPVLCDLFTHVPLSLEGGVDIERARSYKTKAFAAHHTMSRALADASDEIGVIEARTVLATATALAGNLWQLSHPTPTLAALYEQVPEWGHVALHFGPTLEYILGVVLLGLTAPGHPEPPDWSMLQST